MREGFSRKIFEYIGSTQYNKKARGPGTDSFTSALIWSLKELATKPGGFTTSTLLQKIENAPVFKHTGQNPVCSERGKKPSLFKLKIEPLPAQTATPSPEPPDVDTVDELNLLSLKLEFIFGRLPTQAHVKHLTQALSDMAKYKHVPLKKVLWDGLDKYQKPDFPVATAKLMKYKLRRRSIARKLKLDPARSNVQHEAATTKIIETTVEERQLGESDTTLISETSTPVLDTINASTTDSEYAQPRKSFVFIFTTSVLPSMWLTSAPSIILLFLVAFIASAGYDLLKVWTS